MRTIFRLFLVLTLFSHSIGSAIAYDRRITSPEVKIKSIQPNGRVTVEIINHSKAPLRVWMDGNSWGAMNWSVLVLRKGKLETYFGNPDRLFTRNLPEYEEIAGSSQKEVELDLNGGEWCYHDHCALYPEKLIGGKMINFEPNDTIFVVYNVAWTREAGERSVWYGVVATHQIYSGK